MKIDCYTTAIEVSKQILPVSRTLYPSVHCAVHSIGLPIVVGHILCEGSHIKFYFSVPFIETLVAKRNFACGHIDRVLHRNIVQLLVPGKRRQIHFCLPKLIRQI